MVLCCIAIMFFHNYSWGAAISSRRLFFDCQLQSGQVHKSSYCCCLLAISLWSDFSETVQFHQWMRIHWHINYCYYYICLMAFSRTTLLGRHHKGKPFWILLEQEMMGWHWHQLDHIQIICTSLQKDNHASTSPVMFLQARCPSCRPTNSIKALAHQVQVYWVSHVHVCIVRMHVA